MHIYICMYSVGIITTHSIAACGRSGQSEEALKLFDDMKAQGLQPDRVAYNAVFTALRVTGDDAQAFELWEDMCGMHANSARSPLVVAGRHATLGPDIITLTDVIATLTRSNGDQNKEKIDTVFREAVKRKLILDENLDRLAEVDLSGMSLPVARAACRFVINRVKEEVQSGGTVKGVAFITGVGKAHQPRRNSSEGRNETKSQVGVDMSSTVPLSSSQGSESDDNTETEAAAAASTEGGSGLSLRDHIQHILQTDFDIPIESTVAPRAQGTVEVSEDVCKSWIKTG